MGTEKSTEYQFLPFEVRLFSWHIIQPALLIFSQAEDNFLLEEMLWFYTTEVFPAYFVELE